MYIWYICHKDNSLSKLFILSWDNVLTLYPALPEHYQSLSLDLKRQDFGS